MNGLLNALNENIIASQKKVDNLSESSKSLEEKIKVMQNLSIILNPEEIKTILSIPEDMVDDVLRQSYDANILEEKQKQMKVIRYFLPQMDNLEFSLTNKQIDFCKEFISNFMVTLKVVNTSFNDVKKLLSETEKKLEFDKNLRDQLKNIQGYVHTELLEQIENFLNRKNLPYQSKINMLMSILDYNDNFYHD